MKKHAHSNQFCTIYFTKKLFVLIMLAVLLSSCGAVIQAPAQTDMVMEIAPTIEIPATQELTLIPETEVVTEMPTIDLIPEPTATFTPESTKMLTEMQKLRTVLESMKDVDNIVLAPEKVFSDFYNKVIPTQVDLRINESNEYAEFGESEIFYYSRGIDAFVQLVLMGGFTNNDGAYLLLGTEDKITNERVIFPAQFTYGYEDVYATVQVQKDESQVKKLHPEFKNSNPLDAYKLLDFAKEYLGKVVVIQISLDYWFETTNENTKFISENFYWDERRIINNILVNNPAALDKFDLKKSVYSGRIIF